MCHQNLFVANIDNIFLSRKILQKKTFFWKTYLKLANDVGPSDQLVLDFRTGKLFCRIRVYSG